MVDIQLTRQLNSNSGLAHDLIAQGAYRVEAAMDGIVDDVRMEVELIIADDLHVREGKRSKGEGHLINSIRADVTSTPGQFPVTIAVWSEQDEAKVNSLEFGARPHFIWGNPYLYFPSNRVGRKGRRQGGGSLLGLSSQVGSGNPSPFTKGGTGSRGGTSKQLAKVRAVHHPGNRPFHFMRRGLERVVQRRLRQGI